MPVSVQKNISQTINRSSSTSEPKEVGLAEALTRALLLKMNAHNIYSQSTTFQNDSAKIRIKDCLIILSETGSAFIKIPPWQIVTIYASECLFVYNPDVVLDKIIKAILFVRDMKHHICNPDKEWLAHGINSVVNGSNKIITKQEGWKRDKVFKSEFIGQMMIIDDPIVPQRHKF